MSTAGQLQHYRPLHFFTGKGLQDTRPTLLLLNCGRDLRGLEVPIAKHWNLFSHRVCADGGANTLYDTFPDDRDTLIPDVIVGDMDSIRRQVLDYYESKGSKVIKISDQDSTDMDKALLYLQQKKAPWVYVVNTMWGRLDHILGNINSLYSAKMAFPCLYLLSESSVAMVVDKGTSVIHVDSGLEEGHCGLLPLGRPCQSCLTSGLRWNLGGEKMEIGGLVSTCNLIQEDSDEVTVIATDPLLWTMSHSITAI